VLTSRPEQLPPTGEAESFADMFLQSAKPVDRLSAKRAERQHFVFDLRRG